MLTASQGVQVITNNMATIAAATAEANEAARKVMETPKILVA